MENQNISEKLNLILTLQKNASCDARCTTSCTRPFLGPDQEEICYNTRPVSLFTCCTGTNWEMPYELNDTEELSTVFRIENIEGNCATFRVLAPTTVEDVTTYTSTNSFFTIDLDCVLALQCLPDIYIA